MAILYYVIDPMCSWCYGLSPTWKKLLENLPDDLQVIYVQGGLAPHSNEAMNENMQIMLENTWKQIHDQVGVEFNFDFWKDCKPRRSTYLACQAAISARLQNKEYEMICAIQEQYYLNAKNPSNRDTLEVAAQKINLDVECFSKDLESQKVVDIFHNDLKLRDKLHTHSFPSLVLKYKNNYFPIKIDFKNYESMLEQIDDLNKNIYF